MFTTMTFLFVISFVIISFAAVSTGWEHHRGPIVAREEPREYAAWYQMPQGAAAYPPSAYERAVAASAAASQYAGYPRPYSRSPDYYPETAVTNNMVPSGRKTAGAAGYYIPASNTQDVSFHPSSSSPPSQHPIVSNSFISQKTSSSSEYVGIRERAADLRSLSSLLRKTAVTRSPLLKLSQPQMEKLMDDQLNAFVGVVRKLYEWKDWIWWGSMKYLDLAKKRV
uniref:Uncharacterized protein n=1 Tax=Panagrolaimus sp. ES5 TaxID=591445 RepID=A0AC34FDS5_9BILA